MYIFFITFFYLLSIHPLNRIKQWFSKKPEVEKLQINKDVTEKDPKKLWKNPLIKDNNIIRGNNSLQKTFNPSSVEIKIPYITKHTSSYSISTERIFVTDVHEYILYIPKLISLNDNSLGELKSYLDSFFILKGTPQKSIEFVIIARDKAILIKYQNENFTYQKCIIFSKEKLREKIDRARAQNTENIQKTIDKKKNLQIPG